MKPIVECVPNFSEGRNPETIEAIAAAIRDTPGCRLLDVAPGNSTHRTADTVGRDPHTGTPFFTPLHSVRGNGR